MSCCRNHFCSRNHPCLQAGDAGRAQGLPQERLCPALSPAWINADTGSAKQSPGSWSVTHLEYALLTLWPDTLMSPIMCSFGKVLPAKNRGTRAGKSMVHHVQSHSPPSCARTDRRGHTQATLLPPGQDKPSGTVISAEGWGKLCCDTCVTPAARAPPAQWCYQCSAGELCCHLGLGCSEGTFKSNCSFNTLF